MPAPDIQLERKLCLNGFGIPLVPRNLEFENLHEVSEPGLDFDGFVHLETLALGATMDAKWLEKGLKLPARWWLQNASRIPLLQEIRETIETTKIRKGGASRLSKKFNIFVAINIRDKVLLVRNQTLPITLCAPDGTMEETIQWFLKELCKDLEILGPKASTASSSSKGSKRKKEPNVEEKEIIEDALVNIRAHPRCKSTWFCASGPSIRVKDIFYSKPKQVCMPGIKKVRKALQSDPQSDDLWDEFKTLVETALQMALSMLDNIQPPLRSQAGHRAREQWVGSKALEKTIPLGDGPAKDSDPEEMPSDSSVEEPE